LPREIKGFRKKREISGFPKTRQEGVGWGKKVLPAVEGGEDSLMLSPLKRALPVWGKEKGEER